MIGLLLTHFSSRLSFLLEFALDDLSTTDLLQRYGFGSSFLGRFHAFLETLYGAAQILSEVAQLLGTENQQYDDQNDYPMPDT